MKGIEFREGEEDSWRKIPGAIRELCGNTGCYEESKKAETTEDIKYQKMFDTLATTIKNGCSILSKYFPRGIDREGFEQTCKENPEAKRDTIRSYKTAIRA